jgi:hypothetical protein
MKSFPQTQAVKVARYIPEQAMGSAKFKNRRRVVSGFIPTERQRNFLLAK